MDLWLALTPEIIDNENTVRRLDMDRYILGRQLAAEVNSGPRAWVAAALLRLAVWLDVRAAESMPRPTASGPAL